MTDKKKYIERLTQLHLEKTGETLADGVALEYFESLVSLVEAITGHVSVRKVIIPCYEECS